MGEGRRRYTRRQRTTAVIAAELSSVAAASEETGIPESNIRRWRDDPEMAEYGAKTRADIADESRALSVKVLAEIRMRLPEFDPKDLAILFGILTDKGQLLAGEATSRSEHRELLNGFDDGEVEAVTAWLREIAAERVNADD